MYLKERKNWNWANVKKQEIIMVVQPNSEKKTK